jgi:arsenite-transporting ATPase
MTDTNSRATSHKCSISVFAGKGGVGKTTCAAATAFHCDSLGKRTLAVSTDATPSLSHIFETDGTEKPLRVQGTLYIHEVGVEEVREMWEKKFGREVYEVFSSFVSIGYEEFTEFMTSLLPGLGDEFMIDYIRELSRKGDYDTIVWDTAPLGQTLALLETPAMLTKHLRMAPRIYTKLRVARNRKEAILDIIRSWERLSDENVDFLRNEVMFTIVTIPEALAVEQLEHVFSELNKYGFHVKRLIINNVVRAGDSDFLSIKAEQQKHYLDIIYGTYSNLEIVELPMFPREIRGLHRVKEAAGSLFH